MKQKLRTWALWLFLAVVAGLVGKLVAILIKGAPLSEMPRF